LLPVRSWAKKIPSLKKERDRKLPSTSQSTKSLKIICLARSSGFRNNLLPSPSRSISNSGIRGFRSRLQRRVRNGFAPSSLFQSNHILSCALQISENRILSNKNLILSDTNWLIPKLQGSQPVSRNLKKKALKTVRYEKQVPT